MLRLIVCFAIFTGCSAYFWGLYSPTNWNALRVRWDILPSRGFFKMPTTVSDAVSQGFTKISDCDLNAQWRGARYIKDNDRAVTLLFDINSYMAGIQTSVPKNQPNNFPTEGNRAPFVEDGDRWVATAYFSYPASICTTGRSTSQVIGSDLYIQNSTSPEASILIPGNEADILKTPGWTEGKCFPSMGKHYWWSLTDDMSCDTIFPYFLLYNNGVLNGLGFALTTPLSSPIFEHPPPSSHKLFMKSVPKCLATAGTISTMHIYLTDSIISTLC